MLAHDLADGVDGDRVGLLGALAEEASERIARSETWPDSAQALAGRLRRAATFAIAISGSASPSILRGQCRLISGANVCMVIVSKQMVGRGVLISKYNHRDQLIVRPNKQAYDKNREPYRRVLHKSNSAT